MTLKAELAWTFTFAPIWIALGIYVGAVWGGDVGLFTAIAGYGSMTRLRDVRARMVD